MMRPRYRYRNQIKIDYEAQFSTYPILNEEIEKNPIRKKNTKNKTGII